VNARYFFLSLAFLAALPCPAEAQVAEGDVPLVVAISRLPQELHPLYETSPANQALLSLTTPPIVSRNDQGRFVCEACATLPTLDNGGLTFTKNGGLTLRFALKKGLRWGDGYPVTAQDVTFTLDVMASLPPENPYKQYRNRLDQVSVDKDTVILLFPEVHSLADVMPAFPLVPAHLEKGRFDSDPGLYGMQTQYRIKPDDAGLSYGPFAVTQPGITNILFRRNPAYPVLPKTPTSLELRTYQTEALARDLKTGALDRVLRYQNLNDADQRALLQALPTNTYTVSWQAEPYLIVLDVMGEASPALRQALGQSVDWEKAAKPLFDGHLIPASSVFRDDDVRFAATDRPLPDETALKTVLAKEGWTQKDTVFQKSDRSLSFSITTLSGQPTLLALQQVLANALKKQGIPVTLQTVSQGIFYGEQLPQRTFDGLALYIVPTTGDPLINWLRSVYSVPGADPSVPALLEALNQNPSIESERSLWDQIQAHLAAEPRFIPLFFTPSLTLQKTTWQLPEPTAPLGTAGGWVRR
jgi:peptide/nickel transport system substrate-binding protein